MGGKQVQRQAANGGRPTEGPARKRTTYPNYNISIEGIPEGGNALVIRLDAPYERHDFPLSDEARAELGRMCNAPHVEVPDILPPFMKG
jgi:hypothetical protein